MMVWCLVRTVISDPGKVNFFYNLIIKFIKYIKYYIKTVYNNRYLYIGDVI